MRVDYSTDRDRRERHAEEAERFSTEVGGASEEVKEFFLWADDATWAIIMEDYCREHGLKAKDYAESAYTAWKSGRRRMSGVVLRRLFRIVPPLMSSPLRYSLLRKAYRKDKQSRPTRICVRSGDDFESAFNKIERAVSMACAAPAIPRKLEADFPWMATTESKAFIGILDLCNQNKAESELVLLLSQCRITAQRVRESSVKTCVVIETVIASQPIEISFENRPASVIVFESWWMDWRVLLPVATAAVLGIVGLGQYLASRPQTQPRISAPSVEFNSYGPYFEHKRK